MILVFHSEHLFSAALACRRLAEVSYKVLQVRKKNIALFFYSFQLAVCDH